MRPELRAIAARHGGVFTRQHAVACGYTERELKTLTGRPRGAWLVVRRGVYVERRLWNETDEDGRYLYLVRACALAMRTDAVLSHASAAGLHRMPLRPRWRELAHVTRPGVTGGRTENGVKHHTGGFTDADLVEVDGLTVTHLARTAVDVAREFGFEDGVVATDAAIRLGATEEQLHEVLAGMWSWPQITVAREAVRVADGGAQNIGETLLRLMVLELDIGKPETQALFRSEGRTAYVDVKVGRHLFEFDGRVKYVGRERGGVADRPVEQVLWEEKQREDWLRRTDGGHGMSRVIWDEMFGAARARTLRRLDAEYRETVRRHGES